MLPEIIAPTDNVSFGRRLYLLSLLTLSYVLGELSHFLLGVTSREMAKDIHFGDMGCMLMLVDVDSDSSNGTVVVCEEAKNETSCLDRSPQCAWGYTGLGLDYQLLAGPSFILVFTLSGVFLGFRGDMGSRTKLLGAAVIFFSMATIGTGMAKKYWHLVVFRMALAAGESACHPLGVSLISDVFPADEHRGAATGIFHWGIYCGYGLSYLAGSYLNWGWRVSYFVAGVPGVLVGLLLMFSKDSNSNVGKATKEGKGEDVEMEMMVEEENRARIVSAEKGEKEVSRARRTAGAFCQPLVILLFLAAAFRHSAGFAFAYNARLFYLTYYPTAEVGAWLSWVPVLGGATGVFCGGVMVDKMGGSTATSLRVLGISLLLACPFAFGVLTVAPPLSFGLLLPYYLFSETWLGILFVVLVELVPKELKTSIIGLFLFAMTNVGGNSPVLVDPIAKLWGYREALYLFFPAFVAISGLLFLAASCPLRRRTSD